ncbi:5485_t:CDS:1, partial [Cetraspora pellucida]
HMVQDQQIIQIISQPFIMLHLILASNRYAAVRHSKYSELWSFAWQAIQLAVDYDNNNEMAQRLREFIKKKKHSIRNNENKMPSTRFNNCDNESNLEIANPLVTRHKGRPETK